MLELTPPDLDTRIAILQKIAVENDLKFENNALKYIASNFSKNVRELEGAFNKVCAYAEITEQSITLNLAKDVLKCSEQPDISVDKIIEVAAQYYGVDVDDIKGSARGQKVSLARHMAAYLAREITNESYVNIAATFNKKHTTIMFAYEKMEKEISAKKEFASDVREIKQALKLI